MEAYAKKELESKNHKISFHVNLIIEMISMWLNDGKNYDKLKIEEKELIERLLNNSDWRVLLRYLNLGIGEYFDNDNNTKGKRMVWTKDQKKEIDGINDRLSSLESSVLANSVAIKENKAAIEKNRAAINENRIAIEKNRVAIEKNRAAIKENKVAIEKNRVAIERVETKVDKIYEILIDMKGDS